MAQKNENARKLSAAEQRRLTAFNELAASYQAQGYTQTRLTTGIVWANVFAILFAIPFIFVFGGLFWALNSGQAELGLSNPFVLLAIFIVLVVAHELIHGLTWAIFAKNHFQDIEFGFMKEYLTPYCTCKTPLSKPAYIAGAAMPLIVLGLAPSIIAVITGSLSWLMLGLLMIMAAGGDALIIGKVWRYQTQAHEVLYIDHPTEIGGVVFER